MSFEFKLLKQDKNTKARLGLIKTSHGNIQTPVFMPVGTRAAVKSISPYELEQIGTEIILSNAYHLFLRPGAEIIKQAGGLHTFMNWKKPILTDSGGFQIFSLNKTAKIIDEGVLFKSIIDGSEHLFSPKIAIDVQNKIGADIIMVLDQCVKYPVARDEAKDALERTLKWSEECLEYHKNKEQALFGIVQGSIFPELRQKSVRDTVKLDFPGIAIGGFSVGEPLTEMLKVLDTFIDMIPLEKPRYLMGVGDPVSLIEAISRGIEMFDCVLPTRMARNGAILTSSGRLNLKNSKYKDDLTSLDPGCDCQVCQEYTKAYLRFTFMNNEILAHRLLTFHNLYFLISLVAQTRNAIKNDRFDDFHGNYLEKAKNIFW